MPVCVCVCICMCVHPCACCYVSMCFSCVCLCAWGTCVNMQLCACVNCVIMCTWVHYVCMCVHVLTCVWPRPEAGLAPFQALPGETLQLSLGMACSGLSQKPSPVPVALALAAGPELKASDQPWPSWQHGQRAALSTGKACGGP